MGDEVGLSGVKIPVDFWRGQKAHDLFIMTAFRALHVIRHQNHVHYEPRIAITLNVGWPPMTRKWTRRASRTPRRASR